LKEMGYTPQIHLDKAVNLYGYQGDKRSQKAHIVIPRSQVSSASNDLGWEIVNGKIVMHISEYDQSCNKFNVGKLKQLYSKNLLVKSITKKWAGKYSIKSKTVDEKGNIKIRIRRVI
jgi:hypothetical protein